LQDYLGQLLGEGPKINDLVSNFEKFKAGQVLDTPKKDAPPLQDEPPATIDVPVPKQAARKKEMSSKSQKKAPKQEMKQKPKEKPAKEQSKKPPPKEKSPATKKPAPKHSKPPPPTPPTPDLTIPKATPVHKVCGCFGTIHTERITNCMECGRILCGQERPTEECVVQCPFCQAIVVPPRHPIRLQRISSATWDLQRAVLERANDKSQIRVLNDQGDYY